MGDHVTPFDLSANRSGQAATITALRADLDKARADNKRMRAALEPFSITAGMLFSQNWNASDVLVQYERDEDTRLTAGDFFAARAALTSTGDSNND